MQTENFAVSYLLRFFFNMRIYYTMSHSKINARARNDKRQPNMRGHVFFA